MNGEFKMPQYDINTITIEQLQNIISVGDDRYDNQIRCSNSGIVYLSQDIVGAQDIEDVAFCFETDNASNGYVGTMFQMIRII